MLKACFCDCFSWLRAGDRFNLFVPQKHTLHLMWLGLFCWAREYYIPSCSREYEQSTNMVPAYEVCLLPASNNLGSPKTCLLEKHQIVLLCRHIHTYTCMYTGSTRWCILVVYYRQVSQPQASRRTCEKDTVNCCTVVLWRVGSNSGCMQGESEDLRVVCVTQHGQQSLLLTNCFPAAVDWTAQWPCLSCLHMHRANKPVPEIGSVGAPLSRNTSLASSLFTCNNSVCCTECSYHQ